MKEKWKNIFLAIIASGLITGIWAIPQIQFLMSYENTLNENMASRPFEGTTIDVGAILHSDPWEDQIFLGSFCFLVTTSIVIFFVCLVVLYFAINHLKKRKK